MSKDWIVEARARLLGLRLKSGAWGYRPGSSPAVEPSALAGLALLANAQAWGGPERDAALGAGRWLASVQREDGSIGSASGLTGAGWASPLASLLWAGLGGFETPRASAIRWTLATAGRPSPRVANDPMGHDCNLIGWPWTDGTHSWVEPTALALLSLAREGKADHPRALEGVRVLRDRAIPGGGWNLGNPVVFGTTLRPFPGPTGLALLALRAADGPSDAIGPAVAYLREALGSTLAPASLGWGLLGLRAWDACPPPLEARLAESYERTRKRDPGAVELALLLLAAGAGSPGFLGVPCHDEVAADA